MAALYPGREDAGEARGTSRPVSPKPGSGDSGAGESDGGYGGSVDARTSCAARERAAAAAAPRSRLSARQRAQLARDRVPTA